MKARFASTGAALALSLSFCAGAANLPSPVIGDGVTYVTGGIGREEAAAMAAEAKNYPLNIVFSAGPRGAFVSDVKVTIKDKSGKAVLDSLASGPMLLARLPAGRYTITALENNAALHRTVHVRARGTERVVFHWRKA